MSLRLQYLDSFFAFVVLLFIVLTTFSSPSSKIFLMCSLKNVFFWPLGTCFLVTLFNRLKYQKSLVSPCGDVKTLLSCYFQQKGHSPQCLVKCCLMFDYELIKHSSVYNVSVVSFLFAFIFLLVRSSLWLRKG